MGKILIFIMGIPLKKVFPSNMTNLSNGPEYVEIRSLADQDLLF